MIGEAKAETLIEQVLDHARGRASGVEVTVDGSDLASSRFANNSMTQNQAPDATVVSVRVLKGGRQARLSSDDLRPEALRKLVDDALATLQFLEKDPDLLPLPGRSRPPASPVSRFDRATASLGAAERAQAVGEIIEVALKSGLAAAGVVTSGTHLIARGNSRGHFVCHRETQAECSITMERGGSTGWAKSNRTRFAELEYAGLAKRAAEKALSNVDAVEICPGKYPVILEPSAVLDLLGALAWDFAGTSHLDKLSCFMGKLGQKVLGSKISIWDDCRHPLQAGEPFDGEGMPRESVCLVENGVLKNLVYGRRSAAKLGTKSSGHGLPEPNAEGEFPANLVIGGGDCTLEDMVKSQERAILLTRVWYIREVDTALKIVTGMTRDGTFLVEDGKITRAVKNLRFNQSLIELLNNVIALGPQERSAGEESMPAVVPAMLVENFNFSSTTTF